MIRITDGIALHEYEIQEEFVRSSGPGGQHVNKTATAVQLRFDARQSPSLPSPVRERLLRLAGSRATDNGEILIVARRFRSQERNRRDALERLARLIRKAAEPPAPRHKTKASKAQKRRRLEEKRQRSETKRRRRPLSDSDD